MSGDISRFVDLDRNVATNVRMARETAGLSQDELAERMTERGFGFSQATVWKIEQGRRPLRISEAVALADALDIRGWRDLTFDPGRAEHGRVLHRARLAAADAYKQVKEAADAYIQTQVALTLAVRNATDAGFSVTELHTSWLETPPERAVIEARIEGDTEDEARDRLDAAVDAVLQALRERGHEAVFDPAAVVFD